MILQSRFLLRPTPFLPTIPLSFLAAEYKRTTFVGTRGGVERMRGPRACPVCLLAYPGRTSTRPPPILTPAPCPYESPASPSPRYAPTPPLPRAATAHLLYKPFLQCRPPR